MDISNINTSNAYTAQESAKSPVDSTLLKNSTQETPEADLTPDTARQQAFEVNITQEAQNLLAAETTPPPAEPEKTQGPNPDQSLATAQEARQIINIVA